MRVTKDKKPSRRVRYLLYADRKLQRISLKKVSERLKQAKPRSRSIRAKNPPAAPPTRLPISPSGTTGPIVGFGVICALIAVAVLAARQSSPRGNIAPVEQASATLSDNLVLPASAAARIEPVAAEARVAAIQPIAKTTPAPSVEPRKPTPAKVAVKEATAETLPPKDSLAPVSRMESMAKAVEPAAMPKPTALPNEESSAATTITGCLERDDDEYRLKDASGVDAPRARSWRSGFLRKRPSPIALVAANNTLDLSRHVGHRVAATGLLVNRGMQAQTLRYVAASCN